MGVVGGTVQRTAPKSLRGRRSLPLSPDVVELLLAWRKVQLAERLRAGTSWEGTTGPAYVFTTETGRLLDQRNASRAYARALKRAGLQTVPPRFHVIRHTVASLMLVEAGRCPCGPPRRSSGTRRPPSPPTPTGTSRSRRRATPSGWSRAPSRTTASDTAGHRCGACADWNSKNCHQNCHPTRQRP